MKENLKIITILFNLYQTSYCMRFIPLEIDNHPCQPENLKVHKDLFIKNRTRTVVALLLFWFELKNSRPFNLHLDF